MRISPTLCFGCCVVLILLLAGCGESGPELAPVTGRVTLDGSPLNPADVVFQPNEGKRPSFGRTDKDGRYELVYKRGEKGAIVGPHTIQIMVVTDETGGPQLVPPRYNTQSELRAEVEPDTDNVFNFDLKTKPK